MSLHEVRMGREPIEAVTFSLLGKKKSESAELSSMIDEYLANGGKITDCDTGKSTLDFSTMPALINEFSGKLDVDRVAKVISKKKKSEGVDHFYAGENRTKKKSAYGQNIKITKSGRYQVSICNMHRAFDTQEEAVTWRNRQREILGLPPAEY